MCSNMCARGLRTDGVVEMMQKYRSADGEGEGKDESLPDDIVVFDVVYEAFGIVMEGVGGNNQFSNRMVFARMGSAISTACKEYANPLTSANDTMQRWSDLWAFVESLGVNPGFDFHVHASGAVRFLGELSGQLQVERAITSFLTETISDGSRETAQQMLNAHASSSSTCCRGRCRSTLVVTTSDAVSSAGAKRLVASSSATGLLELTTC